MVGMNQLIRSNANQTECPDIWFKNYGRWRQRQRKKVSVKGEVRGPRKKTKQHLIKTLLPECGTLRQMLWGGQGTNMNGISLGLVLGVRCVPFGPIQRVVILLVRIFT